MERNENIEKFEQSLIRRFPNRRTHIDYVSDVRQFAAVCEKEWRDVTLQDIDAFVDGQRRLGLKPATINRRVAALKTFFDFLAEETHEMGWPNPVRFKRHASKRGKHLPRDIGDEEVERLYASIRSLRDRAWFALMLRGGLRVGEVAGLNLDDLLHQADGERPAKVRVKGKGDKERVVSLTADAYAILESWLHERPEGAEKEAVFLNEKGRRLKPNGIEFLLAGYAEKVGLKLTPHQLRHTYARQLIEAGMPVTSLSQLMGHSQITTTQIYTAGADPSLSRAYQEAMNHLESLAPRPAAAPPNPEPPTAGSCAIQEVSPEPLPPDWEAWGEPLPEEIRQASLTYLQHLWHTWPVKHRRAYTQNLMRELKGLWDWFLVRHPMKKAGELNLKDLQAYQTDQVGKKLAPGTVNRRLDFVLGLLRYLADGEEPVDHSVFRIRYLRRGASLPRHLSEAESQRLESFLRQRLDSLDLKIRLENACTWVMLHSGLRSGECTDLRFQDLDLSGQRLIVRQGKGQRDRLVYLSPITCRAIQNYLQASPRRPTDPLWLRPDGKPMSQTWLSAHISVIGKEAKIDPLYPHRLRHTCATRLLNAGMDITRIQKLLGHERISTTMIYARVQDITVENDYRQAMRLIEEMQMPLSITPLAAENWPNNDVKVQATLDDSV